MKKIMRIIFATLVMAMLSPALSAQSFLRYKMKDGSFNGFYTNCVDSICHVTENGAVVEKVYSGKNVRTIPVDDIVDISFESATLAPGEDAGDYRLYELDYPDGEFKKVYVDNRAVCIASKNGDFGANDTIMLASVYNNVKALLFTDSEERITRYFNGKDYLLFDYKEDASFDVVDLYGGKKVTVAGYPATKAPLTAANWIKFTDNLLDFNISVWTNLDMVLFQRLTHILTNIDNNPELHNQRVILNTLNVAGDMLGIGLALWAYGATGGLSLSIVLLQVTLLCNDLNNLRQEMYPDSETMERYKEYYSDKYGINVTTLPAVEVRSTSANLKGLLGCSDGLRGDLCFHVSPVHSDDEIIIPATATEIVANQYRVEASAERLEPGVWYMCYLEYVCKVDGLRIRYYGEDQDFTTSRPAAVTGEASDVTDKSAVIECEFENADADGIWCGVCYSGVGSDQRVLTVNGTGKQTVTLSGLNPATTYSYYASVKYGDKEFKGETRTFTTGLPDISGAWNCTVTSYDRLGKPVYNTYTLTLNKDRSVSHSKVSSVSSSWSLSTNGKVDISIATIATQTQTSGTNWDGQVDDIANPTKITGTVSNWNYNQIGYFGGDGYEFKMTR